MPTKKKIKPTKIMRMTDDNRYTMRHNAAAIKFNKRKVTLFTAGKVLAYKIYQEIYTPDILNNMLELPTKAFIYNKTFSVYHNSQIMTPCPNYSDTLDNMVLDHHLPFFYKTSINTKDLTPKTRKAYIAYYKRYATFMKTKRIYMESVQTFLKSCKSCKQMIELLPESYNWLPNVEGCSDTDVADKAAKVANL